MAPHQNVAVQVSAEGEHLDTMLQGYPFPAILVEEPVGVTLTEQTADISNTDESTEDIADRYFTSFVSTAIPSPANILLKPS